MKKLLAALLAAGMLLSMQAPVFAVSRAGSQAYPITNVTGNPVDEAGKQFSPVNSVAPDQTVYFALPETMAAWINNEDLYRMSAKKITNASMIESIELVERRVNTTARTFYIPNQQGPGGGDYDAYRTSDRHAYIAVTLAPLEGTEERKVEFSVTFSPRKEPVSLFYGKRQGPNDLVIETVKNEQAGTYKRISHITQFFRGEQNEDRLTLNGSLFVANPSAAGDGDARIGAAGLVIRPAAEELNQVTFVDGDDQPMATLSFTASKSPDKFFAKLSTKWPNRIIWKFEDTDAVYRGFTDAKNSGSRLTLSLHSPFSKARSQNAYIYAVDDRTGALTDITGQTSYNSAENCFELQTRSLGSYVISDVRAKS